MIRPAAVTSGPRTPIPAGTITTRLAANSSIWTPWRGPRLERDGRVAWRARDLRELVERRFGVRYGESGIRRLLRGLDLSWQKARPVHPEADPRAQERFRKSCRP